MCGLVGYAGKEVIPFVLKGMKGLEYRGYDSWGFAYQSRDLRLRKRSGLGQMPANLCAEKINHEPVMAIGHTRWATHGAVTKENTHPVLGGRLRYSTPDIIKTYVAHNGVIRNATCLSKKLREHYQFSSETDTECIAHAFDYVVRHNRPQIFSVRDVVARLMEMLEGDYAFLLISNWFPDTLIGCSNGSPLVIAHGGMVASDPLVFAGYQDRYYRLNKGEMCFAGPKEEWTISTINTNYTSVVLDSETPQHKEVTKVTSHYMLDEIIQQADLFTKPDLPPMPWDDWPNPWGTRLVLFGCGSSWHAALQGKKYLEFYTDCQCEVYHSCELTRQKIATFPAKTKFLALTQSGETADTISTMRDVIDCRGVESLFLITNSGSSTAASLGIHYDDLELGVERGVAATKTFTGQVYALLKMAQCRIFNYEKWLEQTSVVLNKAVATLVGCAGIAELAKQVSDYKHILILADPFDLPIALEGALKFKEVAYIHAEGMLASEMKHGPIALIDNDTLTIVLVSSISNVNQSPMATNIREIKARGGKVFAVSMDVVTNQIAEITDGGICIDNYFVHERPIVFAVVLQLLVYHVALLKGLSIDKPRNLAKCVSVE